MSKGAYKMINFNDSGNRNYFRMFIISAIFLAFSSIVFGQQPTTEQRVAAFKQSLAKNKADLKKYQWIETTTVSYKGEVKSVKQNSCYYGADGKVQKVPIGDPAPAPQEQSSGRGGRVKQKVVANKKEEMSDYMKKAVALIGQYVPPDPALIQYSKQTNKIQVTPPDASGVVGINIPDFIKAGDLLAAMLNAANNNIVSVNITTHLDSDKDVITMAVTFSQLGDGTSYSSRSVLDAKSKNINVMVENSGYKPQ